jgi:hypothetical protein
MRNFRFQISNFKLGSGKILKPRKEQNMKWSCKLVCGLVLAVALSLPAFGQVERVTAVDQAGASVTHGGAVHGHYVVECIGADGALKWRDTIENLVTTAGKNDMLDKYLKGSAYTQTFRMGLKGTGSAAAGDTQSSHAGWSEVGLANAPTYSGSRPSITFNSASSGSSSSPTTSFSITSSGTVAGCFMNNGGSATIDNTTGCCSARGILAAGIKRWRMGTR